MESIDELAQASCCENTSKKESSRRQEQNIAHGFPFFGYA
jgi:hypothetical protein